MRDIGISNNVNQAFVHSGRMKILTMQFREGLAPGSMIRANEAREAAHGELLSFGRKAYYGSALLT